MSATQRPTRIASAGTNAKRDLVVIDPFHLVPDTAVLPPDVVLVRRSEGASDISTSESDAAALVDALVQSDDITTRQLPAVAHLNQLLTAAEFHWLADVPPIPTA